MRNRGAWALAGLVTGLAGLASAYFTAAVLGLRGNPVTDVAELVIRLTPGQVAEQLIQLVGRKDKPLLVTGVLVVVLLLFMAFGLLARRSPGAGVAGFVVLGVVGLVANQSQYQAPPSGILPILVGVLTWLVVLALLTAQLRDRPFTDTDPQRRFLLAAAGVGVGSAVVGLVGWRAGGHTRAVAAARESLKLTGVTDPGPPPGTSVGLDGIAAWQTAASHFYRIDTSLSPPAITPEDWSLRIHGTGRPPDDADLRRPAGPTADPALADPQLRVEPRRRPADQQRLVERCPAQGHPRGGRRPGGRGRGQADVARRVDLRDPAHGSHRRPAGHRGLRDERCPPSHRPRLPGPDGRAGALRLRVRVQVGHATWR